MNPIPIMMHSRGQLIKDIAYEWLTDSYNQTKQYTVEYQIILTMMHFSSDRREGSWNELELLNSISSRSVQTLQNKNPSSVQSKAGISRWPAQKSRNSCS
jgi:hypothetical protein